MSKHTEGPWTVSYLSEASNREIHGDGVWVASVMGDHAYGDKRPCPGFPSNVECADNARLIATAPDLLAACIEFVRKCDIGQAKSVKSYAQMTAAIAKVESV